MFSFHQTYFSTNLKPPMLMYATYPFPHIFEKMNALSQKHQLSSQYAMKQICGHECQRCNLSSVYLRMTVSFIYGTILFVLKNIHCKLQ